MKHERHGGLTVTGVTAGSGPSLRFRGDEMSYSDSPHCSNYFHAAAWATHLQTANVLENVKEKQLELHTVIRYSFSALNTR